MKILILGGDGMLGHQLFLTLRKTHDVKVTLRQNSPAYQKFHLFDDTNSYAGIDVSNTDNLLNIFSIAKPDAVINAIGIVKQRKIASEIIPSLEINAIFPHRLAQLCKINGSRLIHISTDCVFTGRQGNYTEFDISDAEDIYGKSKFLGELHDTHCVTIRSSIIGLELSRKTGLIEWFLSQQGAIKGYQRAIYSGLTTLEMSRVIEKILTKYTDLFGLWHISSEQPISKYSLLTKLAELMGRDDIHIQPDDTLFACDRSLNSDRFKKATGYQSPPWECMLAELNEQIQIREATICY